MKLRYCNKCLDTNLRPGGEFKKGVCLPCRYAHEDSYANYELKLKILREKIKKSKQGQRNKGAFDCIIGVSGGKDSTRQAHWVRDRLEMKPLIVCCGYTPKQMSKIGAKNLSNFISKGFDLVVATPAPKTASKLALESFINFGNVCKSTEMALFSTVPRLAIELGVNTIFWGENPALQVGDKNVEGSDEFDGNKMREMNTLRTGGRSWIDQSVKNLYQSDHYIYPGPDQFEKAKINIFYLGAAWDDWSNYDNATYASLEGLTLRPGEEKETGDVSNASMLDEEFTNINMMLKYYKFGFGRATDYVAEKIRYGEITRSDAIKIVQKYDGKCSNRIIKRFCDYVGIKETYFWKIAKSWTNKDLFDVSSSKRPVPKFIVGENYHG